MAKLDLSKVFAWALENGYSAEDCAADPKGVRQAYRDALLGRDSTSSRNKRLYTTHVVCNDGTILVLPPSSDRASATALAVMATLAMHGKNTNDVVSILRAEAQTFEQFLGNEE